MTIPTTYDGIIYVIDMLQLKHTASQILAEFQACYSIVKESAGYFNQLSTDQALEHINPRRLKSQRFHGNKMGRSAIDELSLSSVIEQDFPKMHRN